LQGAGAGLRKRANGNAKQTPTKVGVEISVHARDATGSPTKPRAFAKELEDLLGTHPGIFVYSLRKTIEWLGCDLMGKWQEINNIVVRNAKQQRVTLPRSLYVVYTIAAT
jgi:hypothetical protein